MGRRTTSQWEFGDLFAAGAGARSEPATKVPERRVWTVGELTGRVKKLLEGEVGLVWVTGEVSNLRAQSSGHMYFTLKDASAQLACVLFRGTATRGREALADGVKVVLQGEVTVYEPRGQYQMVVRQVELQGVGALQLAFERLKQRLQAEGLFAQERKRPLPRCPRRVGVVTSATGAALRDVLHVVERRDAGMELVLAPCRVQGDGAAAEIAAAIRLLNEWSGGQEEAGLDLILVTRGGGSLEDLWSFNEEEVARAVAESELPVVSAVGHEIDFTICDFVADLRAATPSAAAEMITEGVHASREFVAESRGMMGRAVRARWEMAGEEVKGMRRRLGLVHPRRKLDEFLQRLDEVCGTLGRALRLGVSERRGAWERLQGRWAASSPLARMKERRVQVEEERRRLRDTVQKRLEAKRVAVAKREAELRLLSPQNVLERGYSITMEEGTGRVVREAAEVGKGTKLRTRLSRGEVRSVVAE